MPDDSMMGKRLFASFNKRIAHLRSMCGIDDSSAEKEERAVSAVKKEAIPMEQFLSRLKQKKLDKYLNIEVRVSCFLMFHSRIPVTNFF